MAENVLKELREALGYATLSEFGKDWRELPDKDKAELKSGIENGTYTY